MADISRTHQNPKEDDGSFNIAWIVIIALAVVAITLAVYLAIRTLDISLPWEEETGDHGFGYENISNVDGVATVHFIDVGQGDCELIVADDGSTMLIDSGEADYGGRVIRYLEELGIKRLDYVVGTHPHSDHIGGLRKVLTSGIEIGTVITPMLPEQYTPTTNSYEKFIAAIESCKCKLKDVKNESFDFGSGKITIFDQDYSGDNLNNYSCVIRFDFGKTAFLFVGDIEKEVENTLVDLGFDMDVDILKVAHHGSGTSSCTRFLDAATPEVCMIECGDNSYNHPNPDSVARISTFTHRIYRTDKVGTIVVTVNADGYTVSCESE